MFDDEDDLPYPLALIACDHVHVDPVGKSKGLLGVFVHRKADAFPATVPLAVYFSFTNAKGALAVRVRLIDAKERGPAILEAGWEMECDDDVAVREFMAEAAEVTFPAPGVFKLQAFTNGELVIERGVFLHPGRLQSAATTG